MAIPDDSTSYEWLDASNAYKSMKAQMDTQFGDDISELLDQYYNLDNQLDRNKFIAAHNQVGEALDFQTKMIAGTPMLYKYYGGIQKLESYYRTEMYDILKEKYGSDIVEIVQQYYDLKSFEPDKAKAFYRSHPQISAYFDMKDTLQNKINLIVVKLADKLPERPAISVRSDFEPVGATQNQLAEGVAAQSEKTWEEWSTQLEEPMQRIIIQYFQEGKPLSSAINSELDYLAGIYGYKSGDALLQTLGLALSK
jgi:cyanate lyase